MIFKIAEPHLRAALETYHKQREEKKQALRKKASFLKKQLQDGRFHMEQTYRRTVRFIFIDNDNRYQL
ncbi:hypothetical protein [Halobacillus kuroshimensis]|uniref:hypothetical protein n=1 Tax=Halobacillus kuroshimensis TaxID=302481 RepID=UPI00048704F2|nr:hypothetical protein [Halobacillus kuroshimensis]